MRNCPIPCSSFFGLPLARGENDEAVARQVARGTVGRKFSDHGSAVQPNRWAAQPRKHTNTRHALVPEMIAFQNKRPLKCVGPTYSSSRTSNEKDLLRSHQESSPSLKHLPPTTLETTNRPQYLYQPKWKSWSHPLQKPEVQPRLALFVCPLLCS